MTLLTAIDTPLVLSHTGSPTQMRIGRENMADYDTNCYRIRQSPPLATLHSHLDLPVRFFARIRIARVTHVT